MSHQRCLWSRLTRERRRVGALGRQALWETAQIGAQHY
jgi:hypothetical protein